MSTTNIRSALVYLGSIGIDWVIIEYMDFIIIVYPHRQKQPWRVCFDSGTSFLSKST